MTITSDLLRQAGQLAVRIREVCATNPGFHMVSLRVDRTVRDVWTVDSLLPILDYVNAQGVVPENDTSESEARRLDALERLLGFVALWSWRENVSDLERLSAIRFHPFVKAKASKIELKSSDTFKPDASPRGPDTLQADQSIPPPRPGTFGDLAAEAIFEEALTAYDGAVAASFEQRDIESNIAAGEARKVVLAAHRDELLQKSKTINLLRKQVSLRDQAEARRAPDPLKVAASAPIRVWTVEAEREMVAAMPLSIRLKRTLTTLINDDASEPGTEARARFVERCTTLLEVIDFVGGAKAPATAEAGRAGC